MSFGSVGGLGKRGSKANIGSHHIIDDMERGRGLFKKVCEALNGKLESPEIFKSENFSLRLGQGRRSIGLYYSDDTETSLKQLLSFKRVEEGVIENEDALPLASGELENGKITDKTINSLVNGIANLG